MSEYLEKILKVAKVVPVFPCNQKKEPLVKKGFHAATQDPEVIKRWWSKKPDALVGMPTGKKSGIWVIDFDFYKMDFEQEVEARKFMKLLPKTKKLITQSGGEHFYYRYEEDKKVPSRTNTFGENIDTRADGGYVIISPSKGYKNNGSGNRIVRCSPDVFAMLPTKNVQVSKSTRESLVPENRVRDDLFKLDPEDYRDRDKWMEKMMEVHEGTGGEDYGRELFTEWSLQDDTGFNHEPAAYIEKMWPSLSDDRAEKRTYGSLVVDVRQTTALKDFDEEEPEGEKPVEMKLSKKPKIKWDYMANSTEKKKPTLRNIMNYLTYKPDTNPIANMFVFDELAQCPRFIHNPPWALEGVNKAGELVEESDMLALKLYLNEKFGLIVSKELVEEGVLTFAHKFPNHPIKNYLNSLEWDGKPRIDRWLTTYAGVKDDRYTRGAGAKTLIGAIARVFEPGAKVDTMLILEGAQGGGKSTLVEILGKEWSATPHIPIGKMDAVVNCMGSWVIEMAEMTSVSRADIDALKQFLSCRSDKGRLPYGKKAATIPRRFVFVGTINPNAHGVYLKDPTGGRRFWPVKCRRINLSGFAKDIDQLWAEALVRYKEGAIWHLTKGEESLAKIEQASRTEAHPYEDIIADWLTIGDGQNYNEVSATEVAIRALDYSKPMIRRHDTLIIGDVLKGIGWTRKKVWRNGTSTTMFCRPTEQEPVEENDEEEFSLT